MKITMIGLAGAGKDTSALILQRVLAEQGYKFEIERYAKPLKTAAERVFGKDFDDRDFKEVPVKVNQDRMIEATFDCLHSLKFTEAEHEQASELFFEHLGFKPVLSPREYQQVLGTEVVRTVRQSAWVDRLKNVTDRNLIITDTRFENEVQYTNILVRRFENLDRPKHPSEHLAWDLQFTGKTLPVDVFDLDNHRPNTLDTLEDNIRELVSMFNFNGVK